MAADRYYMFKYNNIWNNINYFTTKR